MKVDVHVPEIDEERRPMMKLRPVRCLIGVVVLLSASAAAAGGATKAPTVSAARNGMLGEIIVGTGGRTLYGTTMDRAGKVSCTGPCAARWLPLVIAPNLRPNAGSGVVVSMLGTVERPDGRRQVTYHGHPLYLFSGDSRAGQVNGEGLGGRWHALTPSGVIATPTAASATAPASTTPAAGSAGGSETSTGSGSGPPPGANVGMWCAANPKSCVNGVPVSSGQ
jgi:predicted lipoprotein with Yx(FWY)xxD motif